MAYARPESAYTDVLDSRPEPVRMNRSTFSLVSLFLVVSFFGLAFARGWFAPTEKPEVVPEEPSAPVREIEPSAPRVSVFTSDEPVTMSSATNGVEARWADLNQEAIEALNSGEYDVAIKKFEACRAAVPEEDVFTANLAEALARSARELHDSDFEEALVRLERALELMPTREDIAAVLKRWKTVASAEEGFAEDLSEHFRLSYNGDRSDLLNFGYTQILRELETAYQEFGELFGVFPVESGRPRIAVVLYHRSQFDAVTGLGDWAGGVFDGTVRIPVEDFAREQRGLTRVLRHELTHAFIDVVGGRQVPGWLNEGLAQILEWPFLPDRGQAAIRARTSLEGKELFELAELKGTLATWKDTAKISTAYAQSLAFTSHVERMYGERVLYEMVAGCKESRTCEETFRQRTGVELGLLLNDLR